jgi:HTH-type transcriptional regulator/antitoxin HipB
MEVCLDLPVRLAEHLGQQLKSLRKLRGLSQGQLGTRVGVSQGRIAQIEAQPGTVSLDQILRLLQALGADMVIRPRDESTATAADAGVPALAPASASAPPAAANRVDVEPLDASRHAPGSTPDDAPVLHRRPRKGTW